MIDCEADRSVSVLLVILVVLLAFAAYAYGAYAIFTSKTPGGSDFFPRWVGARLFFQEGRSPYSEYATQEMQRGLYHGRVARPDEDQVAFVYPMYAIYFVWPLISLTYPQAQAVWMAVLQFALLLGVLFGIKTFDWRPPTWLLALTYVWAVLFYYSAVGLIVGQFALIVFLCVAVMWWSVGTGHDVAAGVCLALTTIKPQMVFLLVPLILLWAAVQRRWALIGSFVGAMAALVGSTILLVPTWPADFLRWMRSYSGYTAIGSPVWIVTERFFPFLGRPVHIVLIVLLSLYLLWTWRRVAVWTWAEFSWGVSLTLIVSNLIAVRTATTNYVVLLPAIFIVFKWLTTHVRWGRAWVCVIEMASMVGFWVLFALTLVKNRGPNESFEHPVLYIVLPVLLFVVFVTLRKPMMQSLEPLQRRVGL